MSDRMHHRATPSIGLLARIPLALPLLAPAALAGDECVFQEEGGFLCIEMENAEPIGNWSFETGVSGYTGSGYLRWTGPDHFTQPGNDVIGFDFEVQNPGPYWFAIRNYHDHPDSTLENDVWVRLDGGEWIKLFSSEADEWTFSSWFDFGHGDQPPASWDLSKGLHRIEFSGRSFNFHIDRMHFFVNGHPDWHNPDAEESGCRGLYERYCQSTPNSTGSAAVIDAEGSASIAANDLELSAEPVPANQPFIVLYGPNRIEFPFGDGYRCVGGGVTRLPAGSASGQTATQRIDYPTLPPGGEISTGSTWNFQFWFRDPAGGGSFFNLSDALTITFDA